MRIQSKQFTTKNQLNTKEGSNGKMRNKKSIRHTENKQQNQRSLSLSAIILNVSGSNFPSEKSEIGRMASLKFYPDTCCVHKRFTIDPKI